MLFVAIAKYSVLTHLSETPQKTRVTPVSVRAWIKSTLTWITSKVIAHQTLHAEENGLGNWMLSLTASCTGAGARPLREGKTNKKKKNTQPDCEGCPEAAHRHPAGYEPVVPSQSRSPSVQPAPTTWIFPANEPFTQRHNQQQQGQLQDNPGKGRRLWINSLKPDLDVSFPLQSAHLLLAILAAFIRYSPMHPASPNPIPDDHLLPRTWLLQGVNWRIQESQIKTPASLKCWVTLVGTGSVILFLNASDIVAYSCPSWQSKVTMAFVFPKESFHLLHFP